MNNTNQIPSNKKFGLFFFLFFLIISFVSYTYNYHSTSILSLIISVFFLVTSLTFPNILYPINKAWMKFGYLIGYIISPIVIGIIFFGIFTPLGIFLRVIGRDELKLRGNKSDSYWRDRVNNENHQSTFKNQF